MNDLSAWTARPLPDGQPLEGRFVRLERLDPARHGADLGAELSGPALAAHYDYLPDAPAASPDDVAAWIDKAARSPDPYFYAILDKLSGRAVGRLSLLRMEPAHGSIEVGHILYGPQLQRTPGATEAITLLARHIFDDLGYRRFEWKCNDRNEPSKRAAFRFGFSYEGLFRQHMVVKGANRDTAWFAMTDQDWPMIAMAHERWLDAANFDEGGRQRAGLAAFLAPVLVTDELELVRARPDDLAGVVALQQAAFAQNREILGVEPLPLLWDYSRVMATQEVWVDRWPGPFEGALVLVLHADHLELASIAVTPAAQGQGLGAQLLAAAEARARALGKSEVRLVTGEKLTRNVEWYQRRSYSIEKVVQRPDRRVVHFVKTLGGS